MLSAAYFGSGNLNFVTPLRLSKVYARKKKKKGYRIHISTQSIIFSIVS